MVCEPWMAFIWPCEGTERGIMNTPSSRPDCDTCFIMLSGIWHWPPSRLLLGHQDLWVVDLGQRCWHWMALWVFCNRFLFPVAYLWGNVCAYNPLIKRTALKRRRLPSGDRAFNFISGSLLWAKRSGYRGDISVSAGFRVSAPSLDCIGNNRRMSPSYDTNPPPPQGRECNAAMNPACSGAHELITADTVCQFEFMNSGFQCIELIITGMYR